MMRSLLCHVVAGRELRAEFAGRLGALRAAAEKEWGEHPPLWGDFATAEDYVRHVEKLVRKEEAKTLSTATPPPGKLASSDTRKEGHIVEVKKGPPLADLPRDILARELADGRLKELAEAEYELRDEVRGEFTSPGSYAAFVCARARGQEPDRPAPKKGPASTTAVEFIPRDQFDKKLDELWEANPSLPAFGGKRIREEFAGGGKGAFLAWAKTDAAAGGILGFETLRR